MFKLSECPFKNCLWHKWPLADDVIMCKYQKVQKGGGDNSELCSWLDLDQQTEFWDILASQVNWLSSISCVIVRQNKTLYAIRFFAAKFNSRKHKMVGKNYLTTIRKYTAKNFLYDYQSKWINALLTR